MQRNTSAFDVFKLLYQYRSNQHIVRLTLTLSLLYLLITLTKLFLTLTCKAAYIHIARDSAVSTDSDQTAPIELAGLDLHNQGRINKCSAS